MIRNNLAILNIIEQYQTNKKGADVFLKTLEPGEKLLQQGTTLHYVYVIREGISKCYLTENNGKDFIFEFLGAGEIVGEIEFIKHTRCLCNIEALTSLTVYCITYDYFSQLIRINQPFNTLLLDVLVTRIYHTSERASYQQRYPAEYNTLKLLSLLAAHQIVLSKKDLADYLAVSIRSFNRTLKDLRNKSILHPEDFNLYMDKVELNKLLHQYED
ncbi:CRP-like cAMP-binding protein [Chitinophaga niastensis]|uniref:CRP-like cAMP-binding protein n=1 Tax=Chitinophaga niastensis TaxID=536980 RepID=A0A2P8HQ25_CHINA|nr:Crp/Fnr family transcriptional regulator [Chitinophaga niastensis]PSL48307.1 CRP-like cAMP-binding protein [Chitinophaga niastensis]